MSEIGFFSTVDIGAEIPEDSMPYGTGSGIPSGSTAFLTHEPLASAMPGFRPKTVGHTDPSLTRSRTIAVDSRMRMALQLSPFLFRRTITSLGELPPLTSHFSRSKSARYAGREPIIMPRSHVSVARFYDWTEEIGDCYSVSSLYRDIASIPKSQGSKSRVNLTLASGLLANNGGGGGSGVGGVSGGGGGGPLVLSAQNRSAITSPGRMFVRDKKTLTRGEREIIEGIYKNRSDLNSREAVAKLDQDVKSHLDAWWTGKALVKGERMMGKHIVTMPGTEDRILIKSGSGSSSEDAAIAAIATATSDANRNSSSRTNPPTLHRNTEISGAGIPGGLNAHTSKRSKFAGNRGQRTFPNLSPRVMSSKCQCAPRENSHSHDLVKRTLKTRSQDGYWDSRPEAPPSTPEVHHDQDGSSQPATNTTRRHPLYERLTGNSQTTHRSLSSSSSTDSTSTSDKSHKATTLPHSPHRNGDTSTSTSGKPKTNVLKMETATNKIQKTMDVIYSVLEEDAKLASSKDFESRRSPRFSNWRGLSEDDPSNDSGRSSQTSKDDGEGNLSDAENKKYKVQVYLPTALNDPSVDDDDLDSRPSSRVKRQLSRERPLSHTDIRTPREAKDADHLDAGKR